MKPEVKAARDRALTALNAAKAVREACGSLPKNQWPADKQAQFDGHMADWTQAHQEYEAGKAASEQFEALDRGLEMYNAPVTQVPAHSVEQLGAPVIRAAQTAEQRQAARQAHSAALRRFLFGGAAALNRNEQAAYMAGAQQLFGQNPMEGLMRLLPAEQHALVGSVDTLGGFLVPEEFMSELIKDMAGFTIVRPLARVRQTSRSSATFMTVASGTDPYSSGVRGSFRGEGWVVGGNNLPTQDQPRFGRERIPVHIWAPDVIELTMELMEDAAVNLDAEVRMLLAETKAIDEDSAFLVGTGIGQPMGIITEAGLGNIATVQSGAANAQSYAGLVNLFTALPAQYRARATWAMNSFTLGLLMQLSGTDGHPLFPVNVVPTMLWNRPMVFSEFLADGNVNGNKPIIFGDFSYYGIADRMDMRLIRLTERFAPNVGVLAVGRVGGQVLKTQPFRVQNVGA